MGMILGSAVRSTKKEFDQVMYHVPVGVPDDMIPGTYATSIYCSCSIVLLLLWWHSSFFFFSHVYFPASGQAVFTSVVPSSPRFLPSIFIALRARQSQCSSILHRVLLAHALALSASKSMCAQEKVSPKLYEYALGGDSNSRN